MPHFTNSSQHIHYELVGTGVPVALVHGSFATSSAWRRVLANMDLEKCREIVIDLPGAGGSSDVPLDGSSILAYEADAVKQVLR